MTGQLEEQVRKLKVARARKLIRDNNGQELLIRDSKTGYHCGKVDANDPGDRQGFFNLIVLPENAVERYDYANIQKIHLIDETSQLL